MAILTFVEILVQATFDIFTCQFNFSSIVGVDCTFNLISLMELIWSTFSC
ncbi:TPA: hypothetical protein KQV51_001601 [Clostridioides difficile]|nr:hypothetical protein [Clostridioides difficile]MBH6920382.1 hypothetical protein [Clostridioides difficile]MBH7795725.1 hypothetical protein [Clostridioides difficile]MBH7892447.1 hypothetical protein [Clostridioides difficile]MBY1188749.1 hypothetical protein [Clostridioides difficile]MBY1370469.1 hypothetical protein [Clostridioides difficile]